MKLLKKTFQIVEEFAKNEGKPLGITELSKRLTLPKSTVFHIVHTLHNYRWLERLDDSKKYVLGLRLFELGNLVQANSRLRQIALSHLEKLRKETNETVYLVVYDQGEIVYLECLESQLRLRARPVYGIRVPLHCTSLGKAIMAFLPDDEVQNIIREKGLVGFTEKTITKKEMLEKELKEIRKTGYAIDWGEHEEGVRCIGTPIYNYLGKVFAAVSISGPDFRFTKEKIKEFVPLVIRTAQEISYKVGYLESAKIKNE